MPQLLANCGIFYAESWIITIYCQSIIMKSFLRFISRNRLYTVIEVAGMAIALAFIIFIGTYVTEESNYDSFVPENIYVGGDPEFFTQSGTIKESVSGRFPEINRISRMIGTRSLAAIDMSAEIAGNTIQQNALAVDSNFLALIPLPMLTGHRETALETMNSVIVSESFANIWFPDGDAVGQNLDISIQGQKESLLITGIFRKMDKTVLPDCDMIYRLELFERMMPDITRNGNGTTVTLYEMLPGSDAGAVAESIESILKETDALYISGICTEYRLIPFKDIHYGAATYSLPFENIVKRDVIRIFTSVGILLLVFALLNYISLTTAQVGFRAKEMATRRLIGSSRSGIIMRYIGESLCMTTVSFILGFILAEATSPVFSTLIGKDYSPLQSLTAGTASMWIGVILVISVAAGIIPALMVSAYKPIAVVHGEFRRTSKMILGRIFLVVQNAAAIGAVALSIAMFLQLRHMIEKPMGYNRDGLVDVTISNTRDAGDFMRDELLAQPYVLETGWISGCPASNRRSSWGCMKNGERSNILLFEGDTAALRLLGIPVLSSSSAPIPGSYYFTRRTAMAFGEDIGMDRFEYDYGEIPVCGVIGDFWLGNANSNDNDLMIWEVIEGQSELRGNYTSLVIKVSGNEDDAARALQEFYSNRRPDLTVYARSYNSIFRDSYTAEDRNLKLIGIFAMLTIILTVMAMIAMSTYYARQQAKNTALRKIMGCARGEIYRMTLASFISSAFIAAAIAIPGISALTGKWLRTYSYRIDNYWWIYLAALLVIIITATLAISYRAVQLMNTNPSTALRKD